MNERSKQIDEFLKKAGWGDAVRSPLAGDASFRRYERITDTGKHAVLMDAPPEHEDIRPFMNIGNNLLASGLSAPRMLAADAEQGFLLLEDLGNDLYSRVLAGAGSREEELYHAAADVLVELYRIAPKTNYENVPLYNRPLLMREVMLLADWLLPVISDEADRLREEFRILWEGLITKIPTYSPVLVLRDYHADNLIWLPERQGVQRVGLLDFQDAVMGSPAYDLVSFLKDARRDIRRRTVLTTLEYYLAQTGQDEDMFMTSYALLGAQRNCKIIGIFVRLAARDGKANYLSLLPRVWQHLEHDMQHPLLAPLKGWMDKNIPAKFRDVLTLDADKKVRHG